MKYNFKFMLKLTLICNRNYWPRFTVHHLKENYKKTLPLTAQNDTTKMIMDVDKRTGDTA